MAEIEPSLRAVIRSLVTGDLPWPLFLYGPAGTGKTCAALCLLDYVSGGGLYYTTPGLCNAIIQSQQGRMEWSNEGRGGVVWPEKLWSWISGSRLVVLDEIGCREKVSDAHYEAVKTMIDEREFKPFVCVSNLKHSDLAHVYDDRIYSRIARGTMFEVNGKDRRIE